MSERIVQCWRCDIGMMVRKQGAGNAEFPVCMKTKLIIMDPKNPPKSCPVREAWEKEDSDAEG